MQITHDSYHPVDPYPPLCSSRLAPDLFFLEPPPPPLAADASASFISIHDSVDVDLPSCRCLSSSDSLHFDRKLQRDRHFHCSRSRRRLDQSMLSSDSAETIAEEEAGRRRRRRRWNGEIDSFRPLNRKNLSTSISRATMAEDDDYEEEEDAGSSTNVVHPCKRANTIPSVGQEREGVPEGSSGSSSDRHSHCSRSAKEEEEKDDDEEEEEEEEQSSNRRSRWSFSVMATLRGRASAVASDVIAAMDFDETGSFLATGGLSRKIRVCSYKKLTEDSDDDEGGSSTMAAEAAESRAFLMRRRQQQHDEAASTTICTPAKLSSLRWRPPQLGSSGVVGCGDYDGVLTEWDVEQGICISERDEHDGRRIWSIDYSPHSPHLCASASGDSTVKLWSQGSDRSVGVIRPPPGSSSSQVCCAQFGPPRLSNTAAGGGGAAAILAIACADSNVFIYDLRWMNQCLYALRGHRRSASYVRFLSEDKLVSASIDSSLRLWTLGGDGGSSCDGVYSGHRNVKNFVGLSVAREEGLIATGSETNEVFVYESGRRQGPVWRKGMPLLGGGAKDKDVFVGAVCWRPVAEAAAADEGGRRTLAAANSEGTLELISVRPCQVAG